MIQNVLEFDQTFPKAHFSTKSKFSKLFVHMSRMTGDTEASNFPNFHKFEQKINFGIFRALSYFQG